MKAVPPNEEQDLWLEAELTHRCGFDTSCRDCHSDERCRNRQAGRRRRATASRFGCRRRPSLVPSLAAEYSQASHPWSPPKDGFTRFHCLACKGMRAQFVPQGLRQPEGAEGRDVGDVTAATRPRLPRCSGDTGAAKLLPVLRACTIRILHHRSVMRVSRAHPREPESQPPNEGYLVHHRWLNWTDHGLNRRASPCSRWRTLAAWALTTSTTEHRR